MVNSLVECVALTRFEIVEHADPTAKKPLRAKGTFAVCDEATKNGRRYSESLWTKGIAKLQEAISNRRLVGELDHPTDGRTLLQRASHLITGLTIETKNGKRVVEGQFEVLETARGKDLKALIEGGVEVGVSSRGAGSTAARKDGTEDVQESDYRLFTFDAVYDPAAPSAYPKVTEALEAKGYLDMALLESLDEAGSVHVTEDHPKVGVGDAPPTAAKNWKHAVTDRTAGHPGREVWMWSNGQSVWSIRLNTARPTVKEPSPKPNYSLSVIDDGKILSYKKKDLSLEDLMLVAHSAYKTNNSTGKALAELPGWGRSPELEFHFVGESLEDALAEAKTALAAEMVARREELLQAARVGFVESSVVDGLKSEIADLIRRVSLAEAQVPVAAPSASSPKVESDVQSATVGRLTGLVESLTRALHLERRLSSLEDPESARVAIGDPRDKTLEVLDLRFEAHVAKLGESQQAILSRAALDHQAAATAASVLATRLESELAAATSKLALTEARVDCLNDVIKKLAPAAGISVSHLTTGILLAESASAARRMVDESMVLRLNGEGRMAKAIRESLESRRSQTAEPPQKPIEESDNAEKIQSLAGIPVRELRDRSGQ